METSPFHWSKDFVEHLRTVHFGLIGISVALIVITFSAAPYDPLAALREIHQIIELQKLWGPRWLIRQGVKKEANDTPAESKGTHTALELAKIGESAAWTEDPLMEDSRPEPAVPGSLFEDDDPVSLPVLDSWGNVPIPPDGTFYARLGNQIYRFAISQNWAQEHTDPDWSANSIPNTLNGFQRWWEVLGATHSYNAVVPRTLYLNGGRSVNKGPLEFAEKSPSATDIVLTVHPEPDSNILSLYGYGPDGMYIFAVRRFAYISISQKSLSERLNTLIPGTFAHSFPNLYQAARDLESLELEDIERFIAADAGKGREVFEALGMKFPAGQVTLWGIIVLLSVQLYFYLYLRQLFGKLSQNDPGWDVPWIGMDPSRLSQGIFFITVWVLPGVAVGSLGFHIVFLANPALTRNLNGLLEGASLAGALVLATILGGVSWRCRPLGIRPLEVGQTSSTSPAPPALPTYPGSTSSSTQYPASTQTRSNPLACASVKPLGPERAHTNAETLPDTTPPATENR